MNKIVGSIRIALRALKVNRMRSALTMLGIIIGVAAVIVLLAVGSYFGRNYLSNLSGANHYVEPYTLVADSISKSASIIINLPKGVTVAEAAGNVTFSPAISGKWVASKSSDQMVFQPDQQLPLGKYFTATLAINGAALSKDFSIDDDPKVIAVFPANAYAAIIVYQRYPGEAMSLPNAFNLTGDDIDVVLSSAENKPPTKPVP